MSAPRGSVVERGAQDGSRMNADVRLSVEQVSYAYSPNPSQAPIFTLEATSFQVRPGEIVAVLGPNASGKSTVLRLIVGALQPLSGRILLNGAETHLMEARARAQQNRDGAAGESTIVPGEGVGICAARTAPPRQIAEVREQR